MWLPSYRVACSAFAPPLGLPTAAAILSGFQGLVKVRWNPSLPTGTDRYTPIMAAANCELLDEGASLAVCKVLNHRTLVGSLIGGIQETQEVLDFCAKKSVLADVELIPMKDINETYERMLKGDVRYRFVIDLTTL